MGLLAKKLYTPAEYFQLEERSEARHEYLRGIVTMMSGGIANHSRIAATLNGILYTKLQGRIYEVFGSDMRVQVRASGLYTYPDLTIVCDAPEFARGRMDTLLDPAIIVEVLLPSTRRYDRGKKFDLYRPLKSLQAYVLIDSEQAYVDHFQRQADNTWELREYRQLTETLTLPSLRLSLPLADIYAKVTWAKRAPALPTKKRKRS